MAKLTFSSHEHEPLRLSYSNNENNKGLSSVQCQVKE